MKTPHGIFKLCSRGEHDCECCLDGLPAEKLEGRLVRVERDEEDDTGHLFCGEPATVKWTSVAGLPSFYFCDGCYQWISTKTWPTLEELRSELEQ